MMPQPAQAIPAVPPVPPLPPLPATQTSISVSPRTTATDMYNAMRAQQREIQRQLQSLEDKRSDLVRQTQASDEGSANRAGLDARLKTLDTQISSLEQELQASNTAVSNAAAVPGAVVEPPPIVRNGPPEEAFVLGGMFMMIVLLPLSIAFARRLWRRGANQSDKGTAELGERFTRLEQAVDAIAVEVERVGEGQRFISKQFADQRALGAGAAEPIELRQREQVPIDQRR